MSTLKMWRTSQYRNLAHATEVGGVQVIAGLDSSAIDRGDTCDTLCAIRATAELLGNNEPISIVLIDDDETLLDALTV